MNKKLFLAYQLENKIFSMRVPRYIIELMVVLMMVLVLKKALTGL